MNAERKKRNRIRTKCWILTIWLPAGLDGVEFGELERWVENFWHCQRLVKHVQYVRWQLERCPDTSRLHLQACIQWREREGFRGLLQRLGIPNEFFHAKPVTFGFDTFCDYASKEDTREGSTAYEWGVYAPPAIDADGKQISGAREDIRFAGEFIRTRPVGDLASLRPDLVIKYHKGLEATKRYLAESGLGRRRGIARRTFVLCGPTGTGKTSGVYDHYLEPDVFSPPVSSGESIWFDGLAGQKVVIFDEFKGEIPYPHMKRFLDPWHNEVAPIKGAHAKLVADVVFIISNKLPWQWWKWTEFSVAELPELERRVTKWVWFGKETEPLPDNGVGGMVINWTRRSQFDWGVGCVGCTHFRAVN